MEQTTNSFKRAYNRAGLSVAALYGTVAKGEAIALILLFGILSVLAVGGLLPSVDVQGILDSGTFNPMDLIDSMVGTGIIATVLTVFLLVQACAWIVGYVIMRLIMPETKPIEKRNLPFGQFLMIALMCFGVWGVGAMLGNLASYFGAETESMLDPTAFGFESLPYLIYAMIGAPIVEELTFRKALLDGLHDTHAGYAAVVSGLLFGIMHGNHMQFFLAFFLGMIFAMVYQRTGRVIYTMLLHAMINTTATLPELFALGGVEIDGAWNAVVFSLILAGLIVLLVKRRHPLLQAEKTAVPDANRAVYQNVGMRIVRIAGLVLIGVQGMFLVVSGLLASGGSSGVGYLVHLIPLSLVFLTVLLLPKFTKRYEQKPVAEEETV